jgi:Putative zinc- or iron-chelating domain
MSEDSDDPASRKDLESSLRFVHVMEMQTKHDVFETSVRVLALLEEMIAHGQVDLVSFDARRERIRAQELARTNAQTTVSVAPTVDKYKMTGLPDIDCTSLLPICQGRCCQLSFPLTFQDLDEGVIRFEYQRPYLIRHRAEDGYCVHSTEHKTCGVYAQRPAICRSYDCRRDKRIWTDFENKVPAPWPNQEPAPAPDASPAP